ncbi:MAG: acyl carrier protein [Oscillospiraceae bacterium]|jgi:acyl carrier protein|nr:acyl carrier protein [Oscillospiraceae bacterium]
MQAVLEQLKALLRDFTGDDTIAVERDMLLRGVLGLDSYDLASLLGAAEERFGVEIPDRAVMEMLTVGDVADYLARHSQS